MSLAGHPSVFVSGYWIPWCRARTSFFVLGSVFDEIWMEGGDRVLDSLQISPKEKIGILNTDAPNTALVYFDRKGYNFPQSTWDNDPGKLIEVLDKLDLTVFACDSTTAAFILQDTSFYGHVSLLARHRQLAVFRRTQ